MKRWNILVLIVLILSVLISPSVFAFGIATPYFPNDTIFLEPGQTFEYTIKIQNNEDVSFNVEIDYSSDENIAFLNNTDFFISPKSYDNAFTFIIKMPNMSTYGSEYSLNYAAKPLLNLSGQVPMNVEIRKSANFIVVQEGGQGYFITNPGAMDRLIGSILNILKNSYIYLVAIVVIAALVFVVSRLWKMSSKITIKQKAPFTISDAKSTQELFVLIKLMSNIQFDNEFIRGIYSERFKELNEPFLSKKVLTASRKEMLNILK